jgi:predicted nucleic acid-binding protein
VVDASVVVAAILDAGSYGEWAADVLSEPSVIAPHLMPVEVTQTIRRLVRSESVSVDSAALALDDLAELAIPLFEFAPHAQRVCELRDSVTAYDAWYVALAEAYDLPVATLDSRLIAAAGPTCEFRTPAAD